MSVADCIFCEIASGVIPSLKLLDTPDFLAFLDINPLAPGHTLLIPKRHVESVLEAPTDLLAALSTQLPNLSRAIIQATGATGLNIMQNTGRSAGQVIMHLHFHLVPRREGDHLGFRWNTGSYAAGEGEAVCSKIKQRLIESR